VAKLTKFHICFLAFNILQLFCYININDDDIMLVTPFQNNTGDLKGENNKSNINTECKKKK
jgi:hypothetical protein